jgi:hypothetical protein
MQYLIFKYLITAGVVVLVSELAKRSDKLGGVNRSFANCNGTDFSMVIHRKAARCKNC